MGLHKDATGSDLHDPKAHASSHAPGGSDALTGQVFLVGDTTAGRTIRVVSLLIEDGTTASTIAVTAASLWNGDVMSQEDDLGKSGDTGNFALDSTGAQLTVQASGLTGDAVAVVAAAVVNNSTGTAALVAATVSGTDIVLVFTSPTAGTAIDLTSVCDSGDVVVHLTYVTSA